MTFGLRLLAHLRLLYCSGVRTMWARTWIIECFGHFLQELSKQGGEDEACSRALLHSLRRDLDDWYDSLEPDLLLSIVQFPYISHAITSGLFS